MLKYAFSFCIIGFQVLSPLLGQTLPDPSSISIARDSFGVPHIYAPTNAGVAYGLAWATAEDDFITVQEQLLTVRGQSARVKGKEAAPIDIAVQWMQLDVPIAEQYPHRLSPEFINILEAYCGGINTFAKTHPGEILSPKLFPVYPQDILKGYMLALSLLTGVDEGLNQIITNDLAPNPSRGSNAIAISRKRTKDQNTYLAINSHQPLEGMYSWYEAHLISEEGLNILGATFPGGVSIFLGANKYLGWAHTVNHPDLYDIYKLDMHPRKRLTYRYNGLWQKLEKAHARTKVKLGWLRIPIRKTYYVSPYGLTLKNASGFYSLRFPANQDIRAAEQWFRMNLATSWGEFKQALEMNAITGTHIIYADREDNIFYLSNAKMPVRDPKYDWEGVLPGDTSATLWKEQWYPIDSLPQILNPESGYLFNTNNTPLNASGPMDNLSPNSLNPDMGYLLTENNRSLRFQELMAGEDVLSWENFLSIKYDNAYEDSFYLYGVQNMPLLWQLDSQTYPDLSSSLYQLRQWDQRMDTNSVAAALFLVAGRELFNQLRTDNRMNEEVLLTEKECAKALRQAQNYMLTYFDTDSVTLGMLQRHRRGNYSLAVGGGPETLAAMYANPDDQEQDGRLYSVAGESYIELVRFSPEGVEIESVNAYGSSARPESPHYTDQMQLYVQQKRKPMTLDWDEIQAKALRIYHPR